MGKNVGTENFNILLLRSKISVVALSFHSLLFQSLSFFLSFSLCLSLSHTQWHNLTSRSSESSRCLFNTFARKHFFEIPVGVVRREGKEAAAVAVVIAALSWRKLKTLRIECKAAGRCLRERARERERQREIGYALKRYLGGQILLNFLVAVLPTAWYILHLGKFYLQLGTSCI